MACNDLFGGVHIRAPNARMTTIVETQGAGNNCPNSHPYMIPGSNCCAEGRDLFYRKDRTRVSKRVAITGMEGDPGRTKNRREDDDDDDMSDFGKSKRFVRFRTGYKRLHPKASEHKILLKYTAGLLRMRGF
jgi:hypothetical protein